MNYQFKALVDVRKLQELTDELYKATAIPSAIVSMTGEILTGSGWQRICTEFHRRHPEIEKECIESDVRIRGKLEAGEPFVIYRCPRGLVDASSPVVIEGEHVANVFCGQVFTEPQDEVLEQFFRDQARRFGFDEAEYIKAFLEVPVYGPDRFRSTVSFLARLAQLVADIGLARKRELDAMESHRLSQRRLQEIIDNTPSLVFVKDLDGRFVLVNRPFARLFGAEPEALLGKTTYDIVDSEHAVQHTANDQVVIATGTSLTIEELNQEADGRHTYLSVKYTLRDATGNISHVCSVSTDITDRKRAEEQLRASEARTHRLLEASDQARAALLSLAEDQRATEAALRESEERLRLLGDNLPDSYVYQYTHEPDGTSRFLYVSAGVERVHGLTPTEVLRDAGTLHTQAAAEQLPQLMAAEAASARDVTDFAMDLRIRHADGEWRWVRMRSRPRRRPDGQVVWDGVATDITAIKHLEDDLRHAQRMEAVGQLAGGVAHDFNNILAAMMMNQSLLKDDPNLTPATRESLVDLEQDVKRAASLTRQLLLFSRRQIMQVKVLDLNEIVANLVKMLGRVMGEHIDMSFRQGATPMWIEADPTMVEQVVMNLCVNARDAMPKGGRLTLSIARSAVNAAQVARNPEARLGQFVCLTVEDTGCGMDEATLHRIFEPFFTTKEVGKGTGLGLATVYGIVKQHQGWVEVESAVGQGASLRVYLPALDGAENRDVETQRKVPPTRGTETILLVEDEQSVRRMVALFLRRQGYTVVEAANGVEALGQWQQHKENIRLLYSDMVMPEGMTGLDLAERLRGEKPGLKVIITSGYSVDLVDWHGRPLPGMTYVPKPCEPATLVRLVRECLDRES